MPATLKKIKQSYKAQRVVARAGGPKKEASSDFVRARTRAVQRLQAKIIERQLGADRGNDKLHFLVQRRRRGEAEEAQVEKDRTNDG